MAIKHTAVSYYGFNYVEHAEKDFIEMKEHGCDTVILAITEFDMDFWFPNIEFYSDYYTKTELTAMIDAFEKNANFAGLKYLNSKKTSTVSSVINSWRTKL